MEASAWIAFAALMLTVLTVSGGGLWALLNKMDNNKKEYGKVISDTKRDTDTRLQALEGKHDREFAHLGLALEASERRAAEPVHAIREKVTNVELYIRDNYVSKREYEKDYAQLLLAIKSIQESIEKRLDAYEERVEKAITTANLQGRLPLA